MNEQQMLRIEAALIEAAKADTWASTRERVRAALYMLQAEYVRVHGVSGILAHAVGAAETMVEAREPVAWQSLEDMNYVTADRSLMKQWKRSGFRVRALYAAPQPAQAVDPAMQGLSRRQCNAIQYFVDRMRGATSAEYIDMLDAFRDYINSLVRTAAPQPASEQQAARGWHELAHLIDQLRKTGAYTDEEGEGTNALSDLLNALPPSVLEWAVERWNAEVKNRPLVNVHRRTLDETWRQVIRHCGGDPDALVGPNHGALLAAAAKGDGHADN